VPTAFLTGATGFVGGHTARALAAEGWTVRALVRQHPHPGARRGGDSLADLPVEPVAGDLSISEPGPLRAALADVDAIVHVAGLVKARSLEDYREVNARGTERLLLAARESAPRARFVLVSSQAAAGPAHAGRAVREGDPAHPVSWYGVSKREGEEAVERLWSGDWVVLRPGVVYGPGDKGVLTFFQMAASGWLIVPAAASRVQVISAEATALAIARAATSGAVSRRIGFVCDPDPVEIRRLVSAIAALPARRPRVLEVPSAVVFAAGALETLREIATRRSRPFNADKARELLAGDWICDPLPMRRDLNLPPPEPLEQGLRRTYDWYVGQGWLPSERSKSLI
jgi:nucleoside-diphosphate-sugar epimerase